MLAAGKWFAGVVPTGIALGALLGAAVDPHMKEAPAPFWRLGGENVFTASSGPIAFAAGPDDLSPAGGYRPDLDYDAEARGSLIPASELMALIDEPLPEGLPTVTYGVSAAEDVANDAEAVAAEAPEPEPAPEPADPRKSELVSAGLY